MLAGFVRRLSICPCLISVFPFQFSELFLVVFAYEVEEEVIDCESKAV